MASDDSPAGELTRELRLLKDRAGLSLSQLARRALCSKSSLERYLNGKIFPPRETVQAISDACGGDTAAVLALWEIAWAARRAKPRGSSARERLSPAQLPPDVRGFTGRSADIAWLDALLTERDSGDGADVVLITAIAGTAGVGKTALAVHWAHRIADRFPDGQLWVNMRGYDRQRPMTPAQALRIFLRALGVPGSELPQDVDALTGLFRSMLADRRMLIVLDNAGDAEQVRPLLPGTAGSLVLITSRDSLSGLVVRDGATRLRLDVLDTDDAIALLRRLIGPAESESDTAALAELVAQCARLPLALRIAAERVCAHREHGLARVRSELATLSRLEVLTAGRDPYAAIRGVFSWSYKALPARAATLFRRLGLLPVPTWDVHLAAALAHCSVAEARQLLGVLADAHLIESWGAERFHLHDLLRAYAFEHAEAEESADERRTATVRVLDMYRHAVATAMDIAFPSERDRRPRVDPSTTPPPRLTDRDQAMSWLDGERSTVLTLIVHAADNGWAAHASQLAATLYRYLIVGAHHADAALIHSAALAAARSAGDAQGEATALHNLGSTYWLQGRHEDARDHYQRALAIFQQIGDVRGQAGALGNLANVCWRWGQLDEAYEQTVRVLAIAEDIGDLRGKATALIALGEINIDWGHYHRAFEQCREALDIYRQIDDRAGEACSMKLLGDVHYRRGQYDQSLTNYRLALGLSRSIGHRTLETLALDGIGAVSERQERFQEAMSLHNDALAIRQEIGDRVGQTNSHSRLGTIHQHQGHYEQALDHYHEALRLAREVGSRRIEPTVHNGLGEVAYAQARPTEAHGHHMRAQTVAVDLKDRFEHARALIGLARANTHLGDVAEARRQCAQARALFADLGVPESATGIPAGSC